MLICLTRLGWIAPLLAALLAADDRIFLDALHLVCGGTKLTEPATEHETERREAPSKAHTAQERLDRRVRR